MEPSWQLLEGRTSQLLRSAGLTGQLEVLSQLMSQNHARLPQEYFYKVLAKCKVLHMFKIA